LGPKIGGNFCPHIFPGHTKPYNCNLDLASPIYEPPPRLRRHDPPVPPRLLSSGASQSLGRPHRRFERKSAVLVVGLVGRGLTCLSFLEGLTGLRHKFHWIPCRCRAWSELDAQPSLWLPCSFAVSNNQVSTASCVSLICSTCGKI
jgi:hypothetical protein